MEEVARKEDKIEMLRLRNKELKRKLRKFYNKDEKYMVNKEDREFIRKIKEKGGDINDDSTG
jgi:hypothetical protein